uniref:Uncharacterized protein n=1 Tax=Triticum urartu TaxID=4572 RepID=A0A8R7R294_TRIUA
MVWVRVRVLCDWVEACKSGRLAFWEQPFQCSNVTQWITKCIGYRVGSAHMIDEPTEPPIIYLFIYKYG